MHAKVTAFIGRIFEINDMDIPEQEKVRLKQELIQKAVRDSKESKNKC